jgi:putative endonuclease
MLKDDGHGHEMTNPRHASRETVARRRATYEAGLLAEDLACAAIEADGWTVLGRRLRTASGEIDLVAEKHGLLAVMEVKYRPTLADAAAALTPRQQARLVAACDILLAQQPGWGKQGVRFDVIVVDPAGRVRRIADAFRMGDALY